jgi:heterodisulfide reductase subunit B
MNYDISTMTNIVNQRMKETFGIEPKQTEIGDDEGNITYHHGTDDFKVKCCLDKPFVSYDKDKIPQEYDELLEKLNQEFNMNLKKDKNAE